MSTQVTKLIANAIVKHAFALYDTNKCSLRDHTPEKPARPLYVDESTGTKAYSMQSDNEDQFIRNGKNTDYRDSMHYYEKFWLDPHDPISGTGFGRPYWQTPNNPFTN